MIIWSSYLRPLTGLRSRFRRWYSWKYGCGFIPGENDSSFQWDWAQSWATVWSLFVRWWSPLQRPCAQQTLRILDTPTSDMLQSLCS